MTESHIDVLDSYPSLARFVNALADLSPIDRLGSVLCWIGDHGFEWSLSYLCPDWRKGERSETSLVTLVDSDDTVALVLDNAGLAETIADLALAMGY